MSEALSHHFNAQLLCLNIPDHYQHLQAPLLIGCDVRNMAAETFEILSNEEIVAVNQGNIFLAGLFNSYKSSFPTKSLLVNHQKSLDEY